MTTFIELDGDAWETKYELLYNINDPKNASWQDEDGNGRMYETYGEDIQTVLTIDKTFPNHIWTYGDGDNGGLFITNGYHYVNRIGYFITKNAWSDGEIIQIEIEPNDCDEHFVGTTYPNDEGQVGAICNTCNAWVYLDEDGETLIK